MVSERGNQLSSAVSNASTAFGAIASQNVALDSTLQELPPVLRQSNTTFVNLRAALDDLEPLVEYRQAGDQEPGCRSSQNFDPWSTPRSRSSRTCA